MATYIITDGAGECDHRESGEDGKLRHIMDKGEALAYIAHLEKHDLVYRLYKLDPITKRDLTSIPAYIDVGVGQ